MILRMFRVPLLALVAAIFAALPGCAGHTELKAPCSRETSSVFGSQAHAADNMDRCGPMVRQLSVIINDDRSVNTTGDRGGVTVF